MFNTFSDKMKSALDLIRKKARITEENLKPVLGEIRQALLEADTSLEVTKLIIDNLSTKALGMETQKSLN
ncbi:MAG: signal recognition particle receptor subunit alpha, partial [Gammaproteobacteria bacterium]|nr:signal recognition particle receptor subunit alpha [Gammaproteobacteria bacterium]